MLGLFEALSKAYKGLKKTNFSLQMCNLELHDSTYVSLLNGYNSKLWLRKHNIIKTVFFF